LAVTVCGSGRARKLKSDYDLNVAAVDIGHQNLVETGVKRATAAGGTAASTATTAAVAAASEPTAASSAIAVAAARPGDAPPPKQKGMVGVPPQSAPPALTKLPTPAAPTPELEAAPPFPLLPPAPPPLPPPLPA